MAADFSRDTVQPSTMPKLSLSGCASCIMSKSPQAVFSCDGVCMGVPVCVSLGRRLTQIALCVPKHTLRPKRARRSPFSPGQLLLGVPAPSTRTAGMAAGDSIKGAFHPWPDSDGAQLLPTSLT